MPHWPYGREFRAMIGSARWFPFCTEAVAPEMTRGLSSPRPARVTEAQRDFLCCIRRGRGTELILRPERGDRRYVFGADRALHPKLRISNQAAFHLRDYLLSRRGNDQIRGRVSHSP